MNFQNRKKIMLAACLGLLLAFSCADLGRDNPNDPKSDKYAPPQSSSSAVSSSSVGQSSSSCDYECNGKCYNDATQFCSEQDNKVYDKCENSVYNTTTYFCLSGVRTLKCGGYPYKDSEFCLSDLIKQKCGGVADGEEVRNANELCCGSTKYKYNTTTHFCYDYRIVVAFCGERREIFDPDEYFCDGNIIKTTWGSEIVYDGGVYDAVLIGEQVWLTENLYYNVPGSKCGNRYTDSLSDDYCVGGYGRLYDWATAMDLPSKCNESLPWGNEALEECNRTYSNHQGICPPGWHIPTSNDWYVLGCYVGGTLTESGTKLKATYGWEIEDEQSNGTDDYGFSAFPGGFGHSNGSFLDFDSRGYWWTSDRSDHKSNYAYFQSISWASYENYYEGWDKKDLFSVRCVKD